MPTQNLIPSSSDKAAAKKAAVLGAPKKTRTPLAAVAVVGLAVLGGGLLYLGKRSGDSPVAAALATTSASAAEVTLPAKEFDDGQARFFQHDGGGGVAIRYYAVKAPDGSLKAAYDACDACWSAGKGYQQAGPVMICRNCRRKFEIAKIGEIHGGCNPAALKSEVRDGVLVIQVRDILAGRPYFDLPKEG